MSLIIRALKEAAGALKRRNRIAAVDDITSLTACNPALAGLAARAAAGRSLLEPFYRTYVERVSSPVWAISLETAAVLHALCAILRPAAILDLGSGFSSATFRIYSRSAGHGCLIHSVDDDPVWLSRTQEFLESASLSTDGLLAWSQFRATASLRYDLVLHDLGNMSLRADSLDFVLRRATAAGLIVLDDVQKDPYGSLVPRACAAAGLRVFSLRDLTVDPFGRYAYLAAPR